MRARGRAPQIAVPLVNTEVSEGKDAVLTCVLTPSYRPGRTGDQTSLTDVKVVWAVNGREIDLHSVGRLGSKYSAEFDTSTGEATLRVRSTSVYDSGTYSVTFYGRFGIVNDSANLRVLAGPTVRRSSRDTALAMTAEIGARITRPLVDHTIVAGELLKFQIRAEQKIGSSVPRFVVELSNSTVVEGGSLTLEAQVEGFPEPQIRWFKDGKLLVTVGRLMTQTMETTIPNRLKCQLSIDECTAEDSGAYVCAATSASGTAITEAVVSVK
ncbi:unnamed protein product, partial [Dibothriocephalus latus]